MRWFKRRGSAVVATFEPGEAAVLEQVISEVFSLVSPAREPDAAAQNGEGEQWARDLGLGGLHGSAEVPVPGDPITSRLFPAAYREDEDAAADFRRFTENELRSGKAAHAERLLASLPEGGGSVTLDDDDCAAWLGALNDARLALGTALEVTQDFDYEQAVLGADDPQAQRLLVYVWLGELQGRLLSALTSASH